MPFVNKHEKRMLPKTFAGVEFPLCDFSIIFSFAFSSYSYDCLNSLSIPFVRFPKDSLLCFCVCVCGDKDASCFSVPQFEHNF